MERPENQLLMAATTRHSVSTLLRQSMILQVIEGLLRTHDKDVHRHMQETTTRALLIKGSCTLPLCFRRAGDLDITVHMDDRKYIPEMERAVLKPMLQHIAAAMKAQVHFIQSDVPMGIVNMQRLRDEKQMVMPLITRHFHAEDMPRIKKALVGFGIAPDDCKALDDFGPEMIKQVVEARKTAAKRKIAARRAREPGYVPAPDDYYIPTAEEEAGTGLSEVMSAEIITRDRWNIYAPVTFMAKQMFIGANENPSENIGFIHHYEEAAAKVLTLVTGKERVSFEETRAKDLLDLYIRTADQPVVDVKFLFVPYYAYERKKLVDLVRVSLPWQAEFHERKLSEVLYFKKTDPRITDNVKQVAKGLLALQEHNLIGDAVFGERITPENARRHAGQLLDNAWNIFQEAFGVQAAGSATSPVYKIVPPAPVKAYWEACKIARKELEKPLSHEHEQPPRIARITENLEQKIGAMLEGDYSGEEDKGGGRVKEAGAFNAYWRAAQEVEQTVRPPAWRRRQHSLRL